MPRRRLGGLILLLALSVLGRGGSPAGAAHAPAGGPAFAPAALLAASRSATFTAAAAGSIDDPATLRESVRSPGPAGTAAPLGILFSDLSIAKIDGPDPVSAGAALVYTLTVSNAGPDPAALVTVTDTLPSGTTFVDASGDGWTCGFDSGSGTVTCTLALLATGSANSITVTVHAPSSGGVIENTASVSSSLGDPDPTNNTSTVTTTVSPLADLSLLKTDAPDPVGAGATLTYTLSVSNAGPSDAASVSVADTLPGAVAFVDASGSGWSCGESSGTVTCTRDTLTPGAAPDITIHVTAPSAGGSLSNSASVSSATDDPDTSNNNAAADTTVAALADLSITKSDDPDPVTAGATLNYTLSVANTGPSTASGLTVTDTLPEGAAFVSATGNNWICGDAGQVVTCTRTQLAVGATRSITITVTAPQADGTIQNTASVAAETADPNGADNTATETTTVAPPHADLSLSKSDSPDPVDAGDSLTYTLTVANAGPDGGSSLTVTDTLPPAAAFVSAVGTGWTCGEASGTVTCTRAALASGSSAPDIAIVVTAPTEGTTLSNSATVAAAEVDPVPGNNTDTATTTVRAVADLSLLKSDAPDPVDAEGALSYSLAVANAGPSTATSLSVTDTLPVGVGFVSASGSGWSCGQSSGTVTCTRGTLAPGSAPSITIAVTAPASEGPISNTASVTAASFDPAAGNNSSTEGTTVNPPILHADLSLVKSDAPDPVSAGGTLAYTLSVANGGPDAASSLSVADTLPGSVTFVSASGTGWTCNQSSGTVTCTRATLGSGVTAPAITITVTAPAQETTLSNTASVSSATDDPAPGNNGDTAVTTVGALADLSIVKSDSPDPVDAAHDIHYTLSVTNAGPSTASAVTVTDTLPPEATFSNAGGSGWSCSRASAVVTCTRPSLPVSNAPNITITVKAPGGAAILSDTATVSAATEDPNTADNSDTETTTVTGVADLSIVKSDSPDPVIAAATLTYTLAVANAGPDPAANLIVRDDLPNNVAFVSAQGTGWTCNLASGIVTCIRPSLAVGAAPAITITVSAPAAPGSISNSVTVDSATNDPVGGNNSDSEPTTVTALADLSLTKSDSPDPVSSGGTLTYTLVPANTGPSTATTVTVTDTLPAGVTFVSATGSGWTCQQASGVVTCTRGNIPAATTRPLTIVVTAPSVNGNISNSATVTALTPDPDGADNTATASTTVTGGTTQADLSITKTDAPDPVAAGGTLTYTLSVANDGPDAASGLSVTDTLPAGVGFVSASGTGWSCNQAAGTVTCARGTLAVGSAPAITITATAPVAPGPITNTATIATTSQDANPSNNSSSQDTTVTALADLSITGTDAPDPVLPGGPLAYTLTVTNAGPNDASSVTVTDTLPGGTIFVGASGSGWTCGQASGTVTCTRATLATGSAPAITINVTAPVGGTTLTNTATVAASTADPSSANNSDTELTIVSLAADVSIAMSDAPDPVNAGAALAYTVTVANAGPDTASQLTVTDTLPAGVSFQSATGSGWTCGQAQGTVTCTRATLSVGPAPAITISVTAPGDAGPISNTVSVAAVSTDLNPLNNSDTETTTVGAVSDLSLTQSDAPDPVPSGGSVAYTLTVANAGPSPAASISVVDTLSSAVTFVSASGGGWACGQATGVVTCTRPTLATAAEAPAITVTVTAPSNAGTITNSAVVSAAGFDPNTANNADSETTTVAAVADLSIAKVDDPDPVSTHATLTYSLDVANAGPATAPSVVVTDPLPAGTTYVSATGTGWSCTQSSRTVTCTRASLAVGPAPTITITVTAPSSGGLISNTASVTSAAADPSHGNNSATAETTVIPVSDLSIVKSDSPDPVLAGAQLTYKLAVNNAGPDTATSVSVTDTLPPGAVFQSASGSGWSCSQAASAVTCTRGSLSRGDAPVITIVVSAPLTGGDIDNTATVGSFNRDPDPADNASTATTTVRVPADLSIVKTDGPDPVDASAPLTYTLAVTNAGPGPAAAVTVTDTLPAGVVFVSAAGNGWSCSRSGSVVTCTRADLAVGAAPAITIVVTSPNVGGSIDNTATVSSTTPDTNAANNSDTESTTVRPPIPTADLSVAITDSPDPVNSGATLTYTLAVVNGGPSTAVGVSVTNTLPSGVLFGSASGSGWNCGQTAGNVTCTRGNLSAGNAPAITIKVTTPATAATLSDTATVTSTTLDPATGNNTDTESTTVAVVPQSADLSLTQTDTPDPVNAAAALVYKLNVANAGPNPASNVTVTDTLPLGAVFGSATGGGWTCAQAAGVVTCTRALLAVASAPTITITLVAPVNGGSVTNTASVASATSDANPANNAESENTVVVGFADLSIQETDAPDPVPTGQKLTAVLRVANAGPSEATSVSVTDTLPAGTTYVSGTGTGWSCANAAGTVTCTRPTLTPGDAPPISLSVTAPATGGNITNHSNVDGNEVDVDMSDNQASRSTMVLTPDKVHDIAVTKIIAPASVKLTAALPSKTVRVTVQIQNRGGHQEVILDRAILSRLVTLSVQSLGSCPAPTAVVNSFKLAKKNKLNVLFDVTFDCANDPLPSGDGTHSDFTYVASSHRDVIDGEADIHPEDDVCPRSVPPPFEIDPYPNAKIKDKGCGKKKPDETFGAPVITDIVVK